MEEHTSNPAAVYQLNRSRLATVLTGLLDDTNLFSREQWAEILNVSMPALSQWVNDQTIPRALVLWSLIRIVTERAKGGQFSEPYKAYLAIADLPGPEISPHGERIGKSLKHYMIVHLRDVFLANLDAMSAAKQEEILSSAIRQCLPLTTL